MLVAIRGVYLVESKKNDSYGCFIVRIQWSITQITNLCVISD